MGDRSFHSPGRYAAHLSEFYPLVDGSTTVRNSNSNSNNDSNSNSNNVNNTTSNNNINKGNGKVTPLQLSRRASSVASGMSSMNEFQSLVTKRDIKSTTEALKELHDSSQRFSSVMGQVATEANTMAQSLEKIARLKGCDDDIAQNLLSAGGLFYVVANHQMIMANYLESCLGEDLVRDIDDFNLRSKTLENEFKSRSKAGSMKLKLQEKHNRQLAKRKVRNLLSYRESLMNLQHTLDEMESLKHDYYADSYELVADSCSKVLKKVASLSRAQLEISENIARKGWAGGGLDDLLMVGEDPFSKDTEENGDDEEGYDNKQATPSTTEANTTREEDMRSNNTKNSNVLQEPYTASCHSHGHLQSDDDGIVDQSSIKDNEQATNDDNDELAENSFSLPPTRKEDHDDGSTEEVLAGLGNLKVEEQD